MVAITSQQVNVSDHHIVTNLYNLMGQLYLQKQGKNPWNILDLALDLGEI